MPTCGPPSTLPANSRRSSFELRAAIDDFELRGEPARDGAGRSDQPVSRRQRLAGAGPSADTTRVSRPGGKVAILGGGMAGLSAAWRLSEPGWRDRFDSITVYQRGWRLGGKGASSRGPHGRIEEHGLHIWLGYYENAFGMLRECYAELDRATTDPAAPIHTWDQAMIPGDNLGLGRPVRQRLADLARNVRPQRRAARRTGRHRPRDDGRRVHPSRRATGASTSPTPSASRIAGRAGRCRPSADADPAVVTDGSTRCNAPRWPRCSRSPIHEHAKPTSTDVIDDALDAVREALDYERRPDHRRSWLLLSLMVAVIRGILADNLVTDPRGFRAINDEDLQRMDPAPRRTSRRAWTSRWCAACTTWCSATRTPTRSDRVRCRAG